MNWNAVYDNAGALDGVDGDNVKVNYVLPSRRYRTKYWIYGYIATGIFIGLSVILATVAIGLGNKDTNNETSDFLRGTVALLVSNKTKSIVTYNHETKNQTLLYKAPNGFDITQFDVLKNNHLYWIENSNSRIVSQIDNNLNVLLKERRFKPQAMAIDRLRENVYVLDEVAGNLVVMNLRNNKYAILLSDLNKPHSIVLDPDEGVMFIIQWENSILKMNMDGSNVTEIISSIKVRALTVDTTRKRIYWVRDFIYIESSDYEGKTRYSFHEEKVVIIDVAIVDERLFWLCKHSTSLFSCRTDANDRCDDHVIHEIENLGEAEMIRGFSSFKVKSENPCRAENGGCQDICVLSGQNKRSCVCRMGWELYVDKRQCREAHSFVVYTSDNMFRLRGLDETRAELSWPTPYGVVSLEDAIESHFDCDLRHKNCYFTEDRRINKINWQSDTNQTTVLEIDSPNTFIKNIAYDWLTGNIYFFMYDKSVRDYLMLFNERLGRSSQKKITSIYLAYRKSTMALHPTKGLLFTSSPGSNNTYKLSLRENFLADAQLITANGDTPVHISSDSVRELSIDYLDDKIVLFCGLNSHPHICYSEHIGSPLCYEIDKKFASIKTINVHQQYLYFTDTSGIYRMDKKTGNNLVKIAPRIDNTKKRIGGIKIISDAVQLTNEENPCEIKNGGCQQFCFYGSKASCGCKDSMRVQSDGKSCS